MTDIYIKLVHRDAIHALHAIYEFGFPPPSVICDIAAAAGALETLKWAYDGLHFGWSGRISAAEYLREHGKIMSFAEDRGLYAEVRCTKPWMVM